MNMTEHSLFLQKVFFSVPQNSYAHIIDIKCLFDYLCHMKISFFLKKDPF